MSTKSKEIFFKNKNFLFFEITHPRLLGNSSDVNHQTIYFASNDIARLFASKIPPATVPILMQVMNTYHYTSVKSRKKLKKKTKKN
jgi:hypothetical protein